MRVCRLKGLGLAAVVAGTGIAVHAADYMWLNTLPNWGDAAAWNAGLGPCAWAAGNNAKFTTDGSTVTVAGPVSAARITAEANTTIRTNGVDDAGVTITASYVKVSSGKTLTMEAPLNQTDSNGANRLIREDGGTLDLRGGGSMYRMQQNNGTTKISNGSTLTLTGTSASAGASGAVLGCTGGRLVVEGEESLLTFENASTYLPISGSEVVARDGGTIDASKVNETLNGFGDNGTTSDHASITVADGGTFIAKQIRVGKVGKSVFDAKPDYARIHVLTGGVLKVQNFTMDGTGDYYGEVDFNGGVLELTGSVEKPLLSKPCLRYAVREGGAHLRIPSVNRTFTKAFESAVEKDGGFMVEGGNNVVVYMNVANTFNGPTTLMGTGGLIYVPRTDAALGVEPVEPTDNIIFRSSSPIFHSDYAWDVHSNRTVRIEKNVTARIGNGNALRFRGAIRGDEASPETTTVSVLNNWGGSLNFAPDPGRENRFGHLLVYGHAVVEAGTTKVTSTVTATGTGAPVYVSGDGNAFHAWKGVLDVTGGVFKVTDTGHKAYVDVSKFGQVRVRGGTFDCQEVNEYLNGLDKPGLTEVSDTGRLVAYRMRVSQTKMCDSDGLPLARIHIATGGVLQVHHFTIDAGTLPKGRVDFDGGTLKARSTRDNLLGTGTGAWTDILFRVCAGGAIIDTSSANIDVKAALLTGVAEGKDGGLTKKGSGVLWVRNGGFTYTGPTRSDYGQLIFEGADGTTYDLPGDLEVSVAQLESLTGTPRANTYVKAKAMKSTAKIRVVDIPVRADGADPRSGFGEKIPYFRATAEITKIPEVVTVDADGNERPAANWGVSLSADRKTLFFGPKWITMIIVR